MFERNRIDNAPETSAIPVEIALADGTVSKGKLLVPMGKNVADALNGTSSFIEFEPYGGERSYLSKAQLASVRLVGAPKASDLQARLVDVGDFDPYRILGVTAASTREQVRAAYFALAKAYHPDRYATAELPGEVRDYLAAMVRRVNAAYAALDVPERKRAVRPEPIFAKAGT